MACWLLVVCAPLFSPHNSCPLPPLIFDVVSAFTNHQTINPLQHQLIARVLPVTTVHFATFRCGQALTHLTLSISGKKKNVCGWFRTVQHVCVHLFSPVHGCWCVGLLLLTNSSQNSIKEKTEEQRGRNKRGRHQRPILPTVSTCCNIPALTADKPLYKQPAQILPAGRTHSKAFCSLSFVYWSAAWTAG